MPITKPAAIRSDVFDACQKAKKVLFLAPSSNLGSIYAESIIKILVDRIPAIEITAVDDLYLARPQLKHSFHEVISSEEFQTSGLYNSVPSVNFAFTLPTWLLFDQYATRAGTQNLDAPELMYALDVPLVYQTGATTNSLTQLRRDDFLKVRNRLQDEDSKRTFDAIMTLRVDGNRRALVDVIASGEQEYFSAYKSDTNPINLHEQEHYVDIGAYDGDTVKKFMIASRFKYGSIHAFEPDPLNFLALQTNIGPEWSGIKLHNLAVSDSDTPLRFSAKGNMGSRIEKHGDIEIPCVRLDDVLTDLTLLKMDVEGFEANVLRGASKIIGEKRPRMAITCYHHAHDMLDIIEVLDEIYPNAKLKLRHHSFYFYDTIIYVES